MQAFLGAVTLGVAALLFCRRARRARPDESARRSIEPTRGPRATPAARRALLIVAVVSAAVLAAPSLYPPLRSTFFAFCGFCRTSLSDPAAALGGSSAAPPVARGVLDLAVTRVPVFLQAVWHYAAAVLPVFALASFASGLLLAHPRSRLPRGPVASFLLACVLPLCACGVVPVAKAMFLRGRAGVRDGLIFLGAAPLMSPIVALLGVQLLGTAYVAARVGGAALIAAAAALVVPRFGAPIDGETPIHGETPLRGEMPLHGDAPIHGQTPPNREASCGPRDGSALEAGWALMLSLLPYVLLGAVLGAAVAVVLPPSAVARFAGAGGLSIAAATVAGLPVTMCAGEEIIILAPLAGLGIGLGHAIAFSLASTGICIGSLPLLTAVLGRRGALAMVVIYLVLPFLLGMLLHTVTPAALSTV